KAGERARRAHRERLAELAASWETLRDLQQAGVEGLMIRPVRGALVGRFGAYQDPVLRLPMVRNGVELQARPDEDVRAPAAGRVVMVAELPGFEQVVVIDHGAGQLSMLGRLWKVSVAEGDPIEAGDVLASVAPKAVDDGLGTTAYLELRHGEKPVDPAPRLRPATRR
ncbi:MAG: peptidoglycan DD-metalloendopeptidase family protein, partial [Myxococcales bacterium]|nr:peptidoglycan DD-metalloendopeptidase family protein [Myxococcales bacterium]